MPLHSPPGSIGVQELPATMVEVESLAEALHSMPPAQREELAAAEFARLDPRPNRRRVALLPPVAAAVGRRRTAAVLALAAVAASVGVIVGGEAGVGDSAATAEQPDTGASAAAVDEVRKRSETGASTTIEVGEASERQGTDRDLRSLELG